jgi:hypothetical protein
MSNKQDALDNWHANWSCHECIKECDAINEQFPGNPEPSLRREVEALLAKVDERYHKTTGSEKTANRQLRSELRAILDAHPQHPNHVGYLPGGREFRFSEGGKCPYCSARIEAGQDCLECGSGCSERLCRLSPKQEEPKPQWKEYTVRVAARDNGNVLIPSAQGIHSALKGHFGICGYEIEVVEPNKETGQW